MKENHIIIAMGGLGDNTFKLLFYGKYYINRH